MLPGQLDIYLFYTAVSVLAVFTVYTLGLVWKDGNQKALEEAPSILSPVPFRPFLLPTIMTVLTGASFGILLLGQGPQADTSRVKLQGETVVNQRALETELRNEQESHFHTQQELVELRQQLQKSQKKSQQQHFEEDVSAGTDRMKATREALLNRD